MKKSLLVLSVTTLLSACGGSEGGSSAETPSTPSTPSVPQEQPKVMPAGLWEGYNDFSNGQQSELVGVISPSGEAKFFAMDNGRTFAHLSGDISLTDHENYTANVTEFTPNGQANGTLKGTYSDSHIDGAATYDGTQTSTYSLFESPQNSNGASYSLIEGGYIDFDENFIDITTTGKVEAFFVNGCTGQGQISVPDSSINVYEITFTTNACNGNPAIQSKGLGSLINEDGFDAFVYQLTYGSMSTANVYLKNVN